MDSLALGHFFPFKWTSNDFILNKNVHFFLYFNSALILHYSKMAFKINSDRLPLPDIVSIQGCIWCAALRVISNNRLARFRCSLFLFVFLLLLKSSSFRFPFIIILARSIISSTTNRTKFFFHYFKLFILVSICLLFRSFAFKLKSIERVFPAQKKMQTRTNQLNEKK